MDTILTTPQMVVEDRSRHLFRVARRAFTDESVLEAERRAIFDRCWLYLGHSSEIANNCDFITRAVGGRELIFNRDRAGAVHAFLNTCPHRGAMVVREKKGNALSFRCFYHGWSFNVNGRFASRFDEGNYGKEHYGGGCADLAQVPRLESYRDFWFVNFDRNAVSLADYLAGAKEYIDLVADQAEAGMEVVGSGQQYIINANWKLLAENSIDAFHGFPVHSTYFDYLKTLGSAAHGFGRLGLLGERHARPRQRPCRDRVRLALGPADRALGAVDGRGQAPGDGRAARGPDQALRRGARHAHVGVQPQHADLPQPGDQRHHGDHRPHLHAGGAEQDDGERLGARARATRTTTCASCACSTSSSSWDRAGSPRRTTRRRWRTASAATRTCARSAGTTSPRACRATARR